MIMLKMIQSDSGRYQEHRQQLARKKIWKDYESEDGNGDFSSVVPHRI
jgi:hypothetical protein